LREYALCSHTTQLYCLEHGIQPDGYLTEERKAKNDDHGFSTFFSETGTAACASMLQIAQPL
jgi:hypothetical protein